MYAVTESVLPMLDRYEGEGTLFDRREEEIQLENGECAWAWVYVYQMP